MFSLQFKSAMGAMISLSDANSTGSFICVLASKRVGILLQKKVHQDWCRLYLDELLMKITGRCLTVPSIWTYI